MIKPTRFYSNRQERKIAKAVGGKQVVNSGATPFHKGDVATDNFLIEAKTVTSPKKSFSVKREWLDKNVEEAFAMGKPYSAVSIQFEPDGDNYYIIDEKLFKMLIKYTQEEN